MSRGWLNGGAYSNANHSPAVQIRVDDKGAAANRGRPRMPQDTREIILRLARENDRGFTRLTAQHRAAG